MTMPGRWPAWARLLSAFAAGALAVPGFGPLHLFPLPILGLAWLGVLVISSAHRRAAAACGFAFGLALFVLGVGWVYVALNRYGAMPAWIAAPVTLLFASYLALFPAAAAWASASIHVSRRWAILPGAWVLSEWVRGWLFTGFPWLALGYSQVPDSPLGGFAPIAGVYGVSLALAGIAAAMAFGYSTGRIRITAGLIAGTIALGWIAGGIAWTQPAGEPVGVTLVQGNVAQDLKFREDRLIETLIAYSDAVTQATTPLVILPETALPIPRHDLPPDYVDRLARGTAARTADLIVGLFEVDPPGSDRYFNSVVSLGTAASQSYRKHHLVPFGEFIPLKEILGPIIRDWLHVPLSDQTRGGADQVPLSVAGQKVAMNICYEDVFGEEIIRQLPEATLMANVTNDAWYGESWASRQHLQISQMRALETGRWMLRATNTGVTAAIDERGRIVARLPEFHRDQLIVQAQGRRGTTPYVSVGNAAAVIAAVLVLALSILWRHEGRAP